MHVHKYLKKSKIYVYIHTCIYIYVCMYFIIDPFKSILKNRKNRNRFNQFKSIFCDFFFKINITPAKDLRGLVGSSTPFIWHLVSNGFLLDLVEKLKQTAEIGTCKIESLRFDFFVWSHGWWKVEPSKSVLIAQTRVWWGFCVYEIWPMCKARSYRAILKLIFQGLYALPKGHVSRLWCSFKVNL